MMRLCITRWHINHPKVETWGDATSVTTTEAAEDFGGEPSNNRKLGKRKQKTEKTTDRRGQRTWWWRTFILSGNNYPGAEDVGLDVMIVDGNKKKSGNAKKDCRFAHQGHPSLSNQLLGRGLHTDISFCAHRGEDFFHKAMLPHSNAYQGFYTQCMSGLVLHSCLEIFWWQFPCFVSGKHSVGPLIT